MDDSTVSLIRLAIGDAEAFVTNPDLMTAAGHDYWGVGGTPGLLLRPRSTAEVSAILRTANEHGIAVVPRGGASNCSGGMLPNQDCILLDLSGMNRILDIDVSGLRARVEAGVVNGVLNQQLARFGICFSPDPVSNTIATVGGNIIENAGGPHALKYGVTYHHILAVEAVLPDGTITTFDADADGPDLLGVIIGSEGTLAIVTGATVRLRVLPPVTRTLMGAFKSAHDAADSISQIIASGVVPSAVEWLDHNGIMGIEAYTSTGYPKDAAAIVLVDVDGTLEQVESDFKVIEEILRRTAAEVREAEDEKSRATLWHGRLNAPASVIKSGKSFFIGDVTVPRERIPEMQAAIAKIGEKYKDGLSFIAVTGHAGDGDLHPTCFYEKSNPKSAQALRDANNEIIDAALALGGTITGEHGVGTEKREFMRKRFTALEIACQRAIKRVFDPKGTLNPGVLLPDYSPDEPSTEGFEAGVREALRAHLAGRSLSAADGTCHTPVDGTVEVNAGNLSVDVDAQVSLQKFAVVLARHGMCCQALPEDPNGRTVGQLVASGTGVEREQVRESLLGLTARIVGLDESARFGAVTIKDVAGYDTKRLFIGGGGAFGDLEKLTFKLSVQPKH